MCGTRIGQTGWRLTEVIFLGTARALKYAKHTAAGEATMDYVAYWIGYSVMASLGLAAMLLVTWIAANATWRILIAGLNALDVMEAVAEWRARHPDKAAAAKKRNVG